MNLFYENHLDVQSVAYAWASIQSKTRGRPRTKEE